MKSPSQPRDSTSSCVSEGGVSEGEGFKTNILRLVAGAHERRAIESGQVDAIIDPASGHVILLPDAQAALLEHRARFRSLVELSTDGYWEQDEHYRFVTHTGAAIGNRQNDDESILGRTLWELKFDNGDTVDWATHRTQLQWRAIFRDLELRCADREGELRVISVSGEPIFDAEDRFKGYRGITRDITALKQTQPKTLESDPFANTTLDALATQVCVLDAAGTIVRSNTAWRVLAATYRGTGADVAEGSNYLAVCDHIVGDQRVDAVAMAAGIRQVIAGERELFRYEYFCDAPAGQRWFMATVTRLRAEGAARAIVSYEDITEIKCAAQLLKLEYTVARCLADEKSISETLQAVIRAICETQRWDCGRYFRLQPSANVLSLETYWGKSEAAVELFLEKSRGAEFRPGAGLAGRVCQSGEPLWILGESTNARASPMALAHEITDATGLQGAFIFPIIAAGEAIGVLAFASHAVREPDDRMLRTVRSIGNQLGQFLRRRQTEEALRDSEARFRRLTELSSDWYWEQDSQFRFTKIVGVGMAGVDDILGKTLWELPAIVLSDDERIKHKSELAAQWSFCDFDCAVVLPNGQLGYYRISGEPLYDKAGAFIGFHGTGLDITRRKRGESAMREAAARPPEQPV